MKIRRELKNIKRELRARYLMYFRPKYVREQLTKRKGVCGGHGCCGLSFFSKYRKCLGPDGKTCLKWNEKCFSERCRNYPIDEKDKAIGTESYCNFYWD